MQHRRQQHRDRPGEVDERPDDLVGHDPGRLAQVRLDDGRVWVAFQDEPALRDRDLVVVNVDHARSGRGGLGDFMDVLLRRYARSDVEELLDARLDSQVPHRAAEKGPVSARDRPDAGLDRDQRAGRVLVCAKVVISPQPVVVDAGDVGLAGVDPRRHPVGLHGDHVLPPR